nr:TetR/AcrR family transcriptional regulator C-terminal domain-containing protein [Chelatococcus asaccharovorans]
MELLDEAGLEGLTMRKLADALKIQAPSLYWHFANKSELLDGMADALLENVGRGVSQDQPWEGRLCQIAGELRQALLSRRDASRVFAGTYPISGNILRVGSLIHDCLLNAGMDERRTSWSVFILSHYVIGFSIEEQALMNVPEELRQGRDNGANDLLARFPSAAISVRGIGPDNADERFAFGLQILIGGWKSLSNSNSDQIKSSSRIR